MPVLTVIAGPNGSGKSTLTDLLIRQGVAFGEYLNADEIAGELSGAPEWISRKAQQIVRDRRDAALDERRDYAFETVMSHPSHIQYMAQAAKCGFEVRLFFVATENPIINVDRVANRVLHGGIRCHSIASLLAISAVLVTCRPPSGLRIFASSMTIVLPIVLCEHWQF